MSTLSQAKTLGGVGAILIILGAAPGIGAIISIAGYILLLVAIKNISNILEDKSIFNNLLIASITAIIGIIAAAILIFASIFNFIGFEDMNPGYWGQDFMSSSAEATGIIGLIATIFIGLLIVWIFFIISAIFLKKSYDSMGERLNVNMFKTSAMVNLIGSISSIILIGFLIIFIAQILQIVAFFSIPDELPESQ